MDSPDPSSTQASDKKPRQVIERCRDLVTEEAVTLLTHMLEQVESAFLEASDNSSDRDEKLSSRTAFMQAITRLRDEQAQITTLFRQQVRQGFEDFTAPRPSGLEGAFIATMGDHIQARKIAFEGRNRYFKQLYELRQRMALAQGGRKIEEQELPGGPTHLTGSFCASIKALDISPQAQTLLYRLFDQHVIGNMEALYDRYNGLLIEAGLFPHLRPISARPPGVEPPDAQGQEAPPEQTADSADETGLATTTPAQTDDTEKPGTATIDMLVTALGRIQPLTSLSIDAQNSKAEGMAGGPQSDQQLIDDLHKSLNRERKELFEAMGRHRIAKPQLHIIKLVEMLFEEITATPLLPDVSKALICSLHTPFLKAALIDEGFFADRAHPARQLLNLMVRCGGEWVDECDLQHGIYSQLAGIADQVLFDFSNDVQVFEALYQALHEASQKLAQKAQILEQRTQEAALGRDRLDGARQAASAAIDQHTGEHPLPHPVSQFLHGTWCDKLMLMLLRNPEATDTAEWKEALTIIDELLALAAIAPVSLSDPQHWDLINRIEEGLSLFGEYQSKDLDSLFRFLSGEALATKEKGDGAIAPPDAQNGSHHQWPELTEQELTTNEKVVLEKLMKIEPGNWFELPSNERHRLRCKLLWRSDLTSKHVFAGCCGAQAATIPAATLARELCSGRARILGHFTVPFVDRALKAMGNRLRQ
jgi:hypothetical protein